MATSSTGRVRRCSALRGAWLLQPLLAFRAGLHLWGVLISPPCSRSPSSLSIGPRGRPWLASEPHARLSHAVAAALRCRLLGLGRPDHHAPLLLLALVLIGLAARLASSARIGGRSPPRRAIAALGIWVGSEAMTCVRRRPRHARPVLAVRRAGVHPGPIAPTSSTRPRSSRWRWSSSGPGRCSCCGSDRLSIVHVVLFALMRTFWTAIRSAGAPQDLPERRRRSPDTTRIPFVIFATASAIQRLLMALVGVACIAAVMLLFTRTSATVRWARRSAVRARPAASVRRFPTTAAADWLTSGRLFEQSSDE